jgi:hypothetical protein
MGLSPMAATLYCANRALSMNLVEGSTIKPHVSHAGIQGHPKAMEVQNVDLLMLAFSLIKKFFSSFSTLLEERGGLTMMVGKMTRSLSVTGMESHVDLEA